MMKTAKLPCSERSAGFRRQIGEDRVRPETGIE
jgi:hypothetical protein